MKYTQKIKENTGIQKDEFLPGYSVADGLHFDKEDNLHKMMEPMALFLLKTYRNEHNLNIKKILDIGSGAGSLAYFLKKHAPDIEVFTLDGNPDTVDSPFIDNDYHFIVRTDHEYKLVDENNNTIKFDLITSFEHLEHIQEDNFVQFLKNIVHHSHDNTLLFATAACWEHEEEGMEHVHCNVKDLPEWAEFIQDVKTKIDFYEHSYYYNVNPFGKAIYQTIEDMGGNIYQKPNREQVVNMLINRFVNHWNIPREKVKIPLLMLQLLDLFYFVTKDVDLNGNEINWEEQQLFGWAHRFASSVVMIHHGNIVAPENSKSLTNNIKVF